VKRLFFAFFILYLLLFILGIRTLFHGFPDIERFFAEWKDERLILTSIIKFGTLNFAPTQVWHPPLYSYLTFVPIAVFYFAGKLIGIFHDKVEFVSFYFNNTHYFFFIGRMMSYVFYWLTALMIFKMARLFYSRSVSHITTLSFLLIPRFILDFCSTRPDTLLLLTSTIFFFFILKYYLHNKEKYLFLAAFFLGVTTATKYNALFLGSIFIPLYFFSQKVRIPPNRNFVTLLGFCLKICLLAILGFFICNPFFVIQFTKYFYNFMVFRTIVRYYWEGYHPAIFCLTHAAEAMSLMYMNLFGFLIFLFGAHYLFKRNKKLTAIAFTGILVFEVYFGIFLRTTSPMRYLFPLLPIVALFFSSGVNFIISNKRKFIAVLILFVLIAFYNYLDIWQGVSSRPTYLQKARYFIEKSVPEFTTICITSDSLLPQLNMTRASYGHLLNTAQELQDIPGHNVHYKEMDSEKNYDSIFRELRVESMTKSPQYNLLRWDRNIKTKKDAMNFMIRNNVKYIIGSNAAWLDTNKELIDTRIISLVNEFRPDNKRVYGNEFLYIFKIE